MPGERREIIFSQDEFREAIHTYLARSNDEARTSEFVNVSLETENGINAVARFFNRGSENEFRLTMDVSEIGAALMLYCLRNHIPLPKKGQKAVQVENDTIILVVTIKAPWENDE